MSPNVVVLDYGSGNILSAERALLRAGADVTVTADREAALECDGLVVPGVGAFAACMAGIRAVKGHEIVGRRLAGGRPVLGICVGMQVLFEHGVEHGVDTEGMGEWPGVVEELHAPVLPHMGWNTVDVAAGSVLFDGVEDERFYFVHSYGVRRWELEPTNDKLSAPLVTWATHGEPFVAAVENGPLVATQFHPEKSGDAGARVLANWGRDAPPVSKERARRRAEREAAAAVERDKRERSRRRAAQRAAVAGTVAEPVGKARTRLGRWWRRKFPPNDPLAPRRRRRFLVLLVIFLAVQAVVWWFVPEWSARLWVFLLSLLILPVVRVLLYDRSV